MSMMKKLLVLTAVIGLSVSPVSHAESWWDSLKSMLGMGEVTEQQAPATVEGIVKALQDNLGITQQQAEQGLASILNFIKSTADSEQFAELKAALPGVEESLRSVPEVVEQESTGLVDGLLKKASEYSGSVKALNDLKQQFEASDLNIDMIQDFAKTAEDYLNTPEGQVAKDKFSELFDSMMSGN